MMRTHHAALTAALACLGLRDARADHHHHDPEPDTEHDHGDGNGTQVSASLAAILADYQARLFGGSYQGLVAGAAVEAGRWAGGVRLPSYRVVENGREVIGIGDLMLHVHATVLARRSVSAGAMLMGSVPTGDALTGLGMGHVMVMPEAWASWSSAVVSLTGSAGFGYMFGGPGAHAAHGGGMWPLVDPMNAREITYSASAMFPFARVLAAGARLRGATPVGRGEDWMYAAAGVVWRARRFLTSFDIQNGVLGEPFGWRGTLETTFSF